jgi:cytoskeletal protein RodZ
MTVSEGSPTRPRAFGEELRRLRETSGLTIDDIVTETKVSRRIFEALEAGSFQFLPERVFARNFVRQYLRMVGGGETEMLAAFDAAWERFRLASGSHPVARVDELPPTRPVRWGFWLPVAIGALVVLVMAVLAVRGTQRTPQPLPDPMRGAGVRSSPTDRPQVPLLPSPTLPPTAVPEPDAEDDTVAFSLTVDRDAECWIHVRDHDGRTEQRLLEGGGRLDLELKEPVLLTLGNAGVVTLEMAGVARRRLGAAGQVVHLELGRSGVIPHGAGAQDVN